MPEPSSSGDHYHIYILRCADDSLYTGIAKDVDARLQQHAGGRRGARYLRGRQPFELVFTRPVGDRAAASRLEWRIKQLNRTAKERLIAGRLPLSSLLD